MHQKFYRDLQLTLKKTLQVLLLTSQNEQLNKLPRTFFNSNANLSIFFTPQAKIHSKKVLQSNCKKISFFFYSSSFSLHEILNIINMIMLTHFFFFSIILFTHLTWFNRLHVLKILIITACRVALFFSSSYSPCGILEE